jgi:hypothetical protein
MRGHALAGPCLTSDKINGVWGLVPSGVQGPGAEPLAFFLQRIACRARTFPRVMGW